MKLSDESTKHQLLEIYKLHAELADRISQRREGANRLHVSLLVGVVLLLGILLRFGTENFPVSIVVMGAGIIGTVLSISWYIVIRSYRQLNSGKFKTLHELEEKLAFQFFAREWKTLKEGEKINRYWKLTAVENILPIFFLIMSIFAIAIATRSPLF